MPEEYPKTNRRARATEPKPRHGWVKVPIPMTLREDLTAEEKLMLIHLISRCNPYSDATWECWPSNATIAKDCHLKPRWVAELLNRLERKRLIAREGVPFRTSIRLEWEEIGLDDPQEYYDRCREREH